MGWDYFRGYETMILILGLLLYGLVPWASILLLGRLKKVYTFFSPLVSVIILFLFKCTFLFLFSAAQMDKVFNMLCQLLASVVILTLYWIYQARSRIAERSAGVRWTVTATMGLISGLAAGICGIVSYYLYFNGFGVHFPARVPHTEPAASVLLVLLLAYYLGALLISRSAMQPKEKFFQPIVFITVSILGCVLGRMLFFIVTDLFFG